MLLSLGTSICMPGVRTALDLVQTSKYCCGNIICFLSMFPFLSTSVNIVAQTKILLQQACG